MAKINKRFSKAVAVLGMLCLIWGICISIISGVLASKAPNYIYYNDGSTSTDYYINSYWWGGAVVSITQKEMIAGITLRTISYIFRTLSEICNFPKKFPSDVFDPKYASEFDSKVSKY